VGLRVDRALDLLHIDAEAIEDPRGVVSGAEHVAGVAKLADGLVLIHDLETFLSEAERADLESAVSSLGEAGHA
jgi:purine-binding chemotaxis protein CheW